MTDAEKKAPMRVIVIEHDSARRDAIRQALADHYGEAVTVTQVWSMEFLAGLLSGMFDAAIIGSSTRVHTLEALDVLKVMKARWPKVPVVMVVEPQDEELAVRAMKIGLDDYLPEDSLESLPAALSALVKLNGSGPAPHTPQLAETLEETFMGWARAVELRDRDTGQHTRRVTRMAAALGEAAGLRNGALKFLRWGAILHDIGKLSIPDAVLQKAGPLTDDEWKIMRQHPVAAYEILSTIPHLGNAVDVPLCHHEHWDGAGYPNGLKGEQIPMLARVFTIVDVYDALTQARPYRSAWSHKKALEYMAEQSGRIFDPELFKLFVRMHTP